MMKKLTLTLFLTTFTMSFASIHAYDDEEFQSYPPYPYENDDASGEWTTHTCYFPNDEPSTYTDHSYPFENSNPTFDWTSTPHEMDTNIPYVCGECAPIEFAATFLYLKPSVDDSHYVLTSFDNRFNGSLFPKGHRHQNSTNYSPGFSVEAFRSICPDVSSVGLKFTQLYASSQKSVAGNFLYDTNGFPGFGAQDAPVYEGVAFSRNTYYFYSGDLIYNRTFMDFCPDHLNLLFGLHVAYIKFKEHTSSSGLYTNDSGQHILFNHLQRDSRFYGIGPQMGLNYELPLSNPDSFSGSWSIRAEAVGILLCGNTHGELTYVTRRTGPGGVGVDNGDVWRVIPAAHSELGINYSLDYSNFTLALEGGYEFMWYSKCIDKIVGLDVAFAGDTFDFLNSLTFQGPYLRLSATF